jgi:hypothetical protein
MLPDPVSGPSLRAPADDKPLTAEEEHALDRAGAWLEQRAGRSRWLACAAEFVSNHTP